MIDGDGLQFWADIGSAAVGSVTLCFVLFGFWFVQPVGVGAAALVVAAVTNVVEIGASLLVVRHRPTDSAAPEKYPATIRRLLPFCWSVIPVLMIVPTVSEPRWQLAFMLPAAFMAVLGSVALLVVMYQWLTFSADTSPSPSHSG